MTQFSRTASLLVSALFFFATNAVPLEPSMAPIEVSPFAALLSDSHQTLSESPCLEGPLTLLISESPVESPLMVMPSPSPQFLEPPRAEAVNEGCVAIEHLEGYVLQHAQHLKRRVLCAERFCATPNHAIIVDGKMTSMKQMCTGDWTCIEAEKLVNNLNMFVNRRAMITDHITITPYDIRFPRWCVAITQATEITWNMLSSTSVLFAVSFIMIVALIPKSYKSKME